MSKIGLMVAGGLGRIGRLHIGNILRHHDVEILHNVDVAPDLATASIDAIQADLDRQTQLGLSDERVSAVIVTTPTDVHIPLVKASLDAGKHVFCEKPIGFTSRETAHCYDLAKSQEKYLFCALMKRFDPSYRAIKDRFEAGDIGKPQLCVNSIRDHPEPKMSTQKGLGSLFLDMALHNIDLTSWIVNEHPTFVSAMGHAENQVYKESGGLETFGLMLKFPSGMITYIDSCRYAPYGYDQRFEIIGTKGALVAENIRDNEVIFRDPHGDHLNPIKYSFPERFAEAYRLEMDHFINFLRGKELPTMDGDGILKSMEVVAAAEESHRTGKMIKL